MLTLICGIPNSGKTTYSKIYNSVIHLDDYFRIGQPNRNYCEAVSSVVGDVCIEGVFGLKDMRTDIITACGHHDRKVCIWLDTPIEECIRRELEYRQRPLGVVDTHHKMFQPPTYEEGWDEIIIIRKED